MSVKPFKVQVEQAILDDLRERLARTRWPDEIEDAGWDYGSNLAYLKELLGYWQNNFDWRAQEAAINRFKHFRSEIDGLNIHFIHERGKGDNPMPIMLMHGWPDSFYRMLKIIPMLTDPQNHGGDTNDAFDVIVPSAPGYGFSDRPSHRGMNAAKIASLFAKLMTEELGYERYAAHGGDMGQSVTRELSLTYPDRLRGIHLTDINYPYSIKPPKDASKAEQQYLGAQMGWLMKEGAYSMIQASKPQTLAYGLNDSPAGLAAWLIEKFRAWSDCDGDVEKSFTKDELLTSLTIYWATQTINSSIRLYYEVNQTPAEEPGFTKVPTALALFPKDISTPPREWAERFYNLHRWTEMPRGGHFAAMEEPELLVEDIRAFFRPLR